MRNDLEKKLENLWMLYPHLRPQAPRDRFVNRNLEMCDASNNYEDCPGISEFRQKIDISIRIRSTCDR
jgi:hypothetical protein